LLSRANKKINNSVEITQAFVSDCYIRWFLKD